MSNWNKDQTSLLIDLYRKVPCLYDQRNPDYMNRSKKQAALLAISRNLRPLKPNTSPTEIKRKMRTLRFQYTHEKQRLADNEGSEPKLWCYKQLCFLSGCTMTTDKLDASATGNADDPLREEEYTEVFEKTTDHDVFSSTVISEKPLNNFSDAIDRLDYTEEVKDDSKEAVFCRYVRHRLLKIKNDETFEEVTWKILELLRETIVNEQQGNI